MTTHVSDGSVVHERERRHFFWEMNLWLELTMCKLEYVREDHPLVQWIVARVARLRVTTDPVDCMTCLIRMAES